MMPTLFEITAGIVVAIVTILLFYLVVYLTNSPSCSYDSCGERTNVGSFGCDICGKKLGDAWVKQIHFYHTECWDKRNSGGVTYTTVAWTDVGPNP